MRRQFLRRLVVLTLSILLALPGQAHAQPIIDWKTAAAHVRNVIAHVGEAYVVMKDWRKKMLAKAEWAEEKANATLEMRRDLERQAYGELGAIGKGLPDWTEFSNVCDYDVKVKGTTPDGLDIEEEVSVCNVDNIADKHINRVLSLGIARVRRDAFDGTNLIEEEIETLVGKSTSPFIKRLARSGDHPLNELERYHATQAEAANNLDSLAVALDSLVSTIQTEEKLDSIVSSGRANQIAAHLSIQEAMVDVELTRQKAQHLRVQTLDVMDRLMLLRQAESRMTRFRVF